MTEKERELVISSVRATLLSVKGAITIKQCNRDYRELIGDWIPFKKLGYPSLEKFFLEIPGFRTTQRNGEWYVDAIAREETKHIADMVSRQKSSKKSVKLVHPNRFPKRQGSWRNSEPSTSYASNYNNQYYRANKGGTPFNNNYNSRYSNYNSNYNNKYTNKTETKSTNYTVKPNEKKTTTTYPGTKTTVYPGKPEPKVTETDKTASTRSYNGSSQASREVNTITEEFKHSMRTESEVKPSGKISASQRLSNLRDRPNTVDLIPLQMPAANNESMLKHSMRTESEVKPSGKISASQRLSNLRERPNTVDLIPLQMPAANNESMYSYTSAEEDPVAHAAPAHKLEPPPESTSAVAKLEWTCRKLGLPQPVYKLHDIRPKRGPVSYDCTCKVGTQYSASSYPDSSPSEELAKEVVAVKLISVIESYEAGGLPTSSSSLAMSCLAELVAEHEAGIWASTVPHLYRKKYGENLPSNWQELVENCNKIITDRVVNGLLVLLPNNEEAPPVSPFLDATLMDGTIDSDLPPLQFPKEDFWNVFITVAPSPIEIWLRIIGEEYSDVFEALLAEMSSYYERSGTLVDKAMLIKGAWYAVKLEDGGWQRAKILEIEGDIVNVFLGDHGDDDTVSVEKIKILEPWFRQLPAQAILCRLENAEELARCEAGCALVRRRLPGEVLVAAPGPRADPADPSVALTLYDTSTPRDLNLNKEIIHDFCIAGAFTLTQKPVEVEVGCVTDEGRVWVSRAGGAALVAAALAVLTAPDSPYRRPLPPAPPAPPAAAALYIVRTLDGEWVRCTIISGLDGEGTVRTQLVDSGLILRAPLSSLVPLQNFSPALNAYPYQAMQVRLGSAERAASGMVGRLRELLVGARVLCRALPAPPAPPAPPAHGPPAPPNVELFVRTGPQNILASVNNSIQMEYDFINQDKLREEEKKKDQTDQVEALNRKKERIFGSGSASGAGAGVGGGDSALPPPALPAVGKVFDVYIAMAANPWNFVVQPNSTRHTLQTMMESLQKECAKLSENDAPVNPASGELYTVYYDKDSSWYRVTVAGTVSADMVSVYFCDYGDLALFSCRALRPVPRAVPLARTLPPQAIKAKLFDVWPLHQDWTVEDCIRFQELCVEQQFVGVCKDVGRDPLNPGEPLLTLDLIDTTTDEDIFLNKQLVTEGRARHATAAAT